MEIVMIKKQGCMPCEQFEPDARKIAEENGIKFRTIPQEIMPVKMRPPFFPYFHLLTSIQDAQLKTALKKLRKSIEAKEVLTPKDFENYENARELSENPRFYHFS